MEEILARLRYVSVEQKKIKLKTKENKRELRDIRCLGLFKSFWTVDIKDEVLYVCLQIVFHYELHFKRFENTRYN